MFAVFQLPLTDVRPFLDLPTHRLAQPAWPITHLSDEPRRRPFVRGFGSARERPQGGVQEWPAEDAFCNLSHALRLQGRVLQGGQALLGAEGRSYCAFRRLFWDGQLQRAGAVVGRAEVGFGLRLDPAHPGLEAAALARTLDGLLGHPVRVGPSQDGKPLRLSAAGEPLARAYLHASTAHAQRAALAEADWWLQAGTPMLIVEYVREREVDALPRGTRAVALEVTALSNVRIFLGRRSIDGRERPVWFLETDPAGAPRDALRRLRINLTRLHAALASLRLLSDLQRSGRLLPAGGEGRENLRRFLNHYLPFVYQSQYQGYPWTDFLRAALSLSEALRPGSFTTLRELLPDPGRGLNQQLDLAERQLDGLKPAAPDAPQWDIFLAHAGADLAVAEAVFDAIGDRARVFLDTRRLVRGDDWDLRLPAAQQASFMTVALVGDTYDRAYYLRSEVAAAISQARLDAERHRVVPVYLGGEAARAQATPYGLNLKHGIAWPEAGGVQAVADAIVAALQAARARAAA